MSFPSELESFEAYARLYPERTVFLIDTYDTLGSGLSNAIRAGRPLSDAGRRFGVRLDSGDIDYLSKEVRKGLNAAGLPDAFIIVSNELNEDIIEHLVASGAPVDKWGVGTSLVTGGAESSFTGVYKLSAIERGGRLEPTMKLSDTPEKSTTPGIKEVYRLYGEDGLAIADIIAVEGEEPKAGRQCVIHHPSGDWRRIALTPSRVVALHENVMSGGRVSVKFPGLSELREGIKARLESFDGTYLRLLNPHIYKVSLSTKLRDLKLGFIARGQREHRHSAPKRETEP
jgi:nicotinate phosphoribosyltransferase